jgi:hypothetical protein
VAPSWQSLTGALSQELHRLMEERGLWQGQEVGGSLLE